MRTTSPSAILAALLAAQSPNESGQVAPFHCTLSAVFPHISWGRKAVTHRARNRRRKAKRVKALAAGRRRA